MASNNQNGPHRSVEPDLLIGIDFGMTCTGVSYANLARSKSTSSVRTIQSWPGRMQANENKVPTILSYSRSTKQLSKWGFEAESPLERQNPDREAVDWFKVLLDESYYNKMKALEQGRGSIPESMDEVEAYFFDYLSALYKHIEIRLAVELPAGKTWNQTRIEFVFSVPTTWQPHPTVERFRSIASRAGYGMEDHHSLAIGLTEAEAAAVHTSVEAPGLFTVGDVLLVCDIGGGTTDLSVLKVKSKSDAGSLQLSQMDVVQGRTIGSAKIDEAFEKLATQRLIVANSQKPIQGVVLEDVAWRMMKSREFQNSKCEFGSADDTPMFVVPTPGIENSYVSEVAQILHGGMRFAKGDMQALFDTQIVGLYDLIDQQIDRFKFANPGERITHLILSGGLGNSAYVQERLKTKYSTLQQANSIGPDSEQASQVQVLVAPDPQLAVCKGILSDRISILTSGSGILPWRCARASYGMICKVKYDPSNPNHVGKKRVADPYTGELFIPSTVEWFIKKGQAVNASTPIIRPFTKKLPPGSGTRTFPSSVVVSHVDAAQLPYQVVDGGDARILAEVTADLKSVPETSFKLKNRHWWNTGKKYRRCCYDVKVVIGPADILFELWFQGRKLSEDTPMPVEWMDAPAAPLGALERNNTGLYDFPELPAMSKSRKVGTTVPSPPTVISNLQPLRSTSDFVAVSQNKAAQQSVVSLASTAVNPTTPSPAGAVATLANVHEMPLRHTSVYEMPTGNFASFAAANRSLNVAEMPALSSPVGDWQHYEPIIYELPATNITAMDAQDKQAAVQVQENELRPGLGAH